MKCDRCGGKMVEENVQYTLLYEGRFVIVENVPARVCHQCGEKFFDPEVVERLQNIIWNQQQPVRTIETFVFNLEAA